MGNYHIGASDPSPSGLPPDLGFKDNWIRDQVLELYHWSKNDHEQRFCTDWYYYYRHWKNYVDRRVSPDDYKSNIGVGLAFPIIEILHARLMQPWLEGEGELIGAIAEEQAGEQKAPTVAAFVNNVMQERIPRSWAKHSMMIKSALIFGRGVMRPYVRYMPPMNLLRRLPVMIRSMRVGSRVDYAEIPATRRLDMEYVDPFDWWKVPGVRFLHETDWTFERGYCTTAQAHMRQASGEWLEDVPVSETDAAGYDEWHLKRLNLESGWTDQVRTQNAQHKNPHRVIRFEGQLEVKDSPASKPRYEARTVELLDERYLVKNNDLMTWDGKPGYIEWEPTLDPGAERPIGVIEPLEDILLEINDYENIALDNARKILESPILIDPLSTKQKKLFLGPAELNWVRNPRASVMPLEMKDLPRSFYSQIGFLNDLVQRISGVSDYFGGMNTGDTSRLSQTATGMQLMASLSASRFGPLLGSLDREYYRPAARWVHETAKVWMSSSENVRLPGNLSSPYTSVGPDELDSMIAYHFNTKSMDPKSEKRRDAFVRMIELLGSLEQSMMMQGYSLDYYEISKILMDEFDRGAEAEKIIKDMRVEGAMLPVVPGAPGMPSMYPGVPGAPGQAPGQAPMPPAPPGAAGAAA